MRVDPLRAVSSYKNLSSLRSSNQSPDIKSGSNFKEAVTNFVEEVNNLQLNANSKIESFVKGEESDIHEVVTAVEEANIAFQMLVEMRNKLLESYKDITRMQV